ncbi:cyclic nucleotide-gated ion channel 1-like [Carya illinoinensis]|uniref:cyclic nucleotide-gated ion channel 1-like n=1 Tax=Carya illinoinensis TaxID=32201 RepID=UPI001C724812|nr:cyclic nucleotide-gated ion channel 1-like [Carya illinoinensis]
MLKAKSEQQLLLICEYLKLVHYNERNYIVRKGDPLDAILFITQGICWTSKNSDGRGRTQCIEKGHSYGEELLDWGFNDSPPSDLPISKETVKAHTKVEAFALMANDLTTAISRHTKQLPLQKQLYEQFVSALLKRRTKILRRWRSRSKEGFHALDTS